jgi:hypothetical protein
MRQRHFIARRAALAQALTLPFGARAGGIGGAWAQSPVATAPIRPALAIPSSERIRFQMRRNGDIIGAHELTFAREGGLLVVSVAIDILVKFGPIPIYRYSHRASERWVDGRFMAIESRTDRDGKSLTLRAVRQSQGLVVEGSFGPSYVAPEGVLPTTYWNKAMLTGQAINSEDGELMKAPFQELGLEPVPTASGAAVVARHYRIGGDLPVDLWYDEAGQWVHLVFEKNGSRVVYEKL